MLNKLIKSLEICPIVKKGEYNYFVHQITDGIPFLDAGVLRETACGMIKILDLKNVDYIVVAEAMGIPIGTVLSVMTDIPLNIIRKREYNLSNEYEVIQETGYSKGKLFINGLKKGDKIVIIDDVVSTGGTTRGILKTLDKIGVEVVDICYVIKKGEPILPVPYKYLVSIEVTDLVKIIDSI